MKWFDVGLEAHGVVAVGQFATGVVAIGQSALGVIAVGQLARGVVVVGQLAVGVWSIGQLSYGVIWTAGMLGMALQSPGMFVVRIVGRDEEGAQRWDAARLPFVVLGLLVLAAGWWFLVGNSLLTDVFAEGGVLRPERQPR